MTESPTADDYDKLTGDEGAVEAPDHPRPITADAQMARKRAIREGRLRSIPRSEYEPRRFGVEGSNVTNEPGEPLLGSSLQPSEVDIAGVSIALGDIVAAAHLRSGLSAADWNALDDKLREAKIFEQILEMQAAAELTE